MRTEPREVSTASGELSAVELEAVAERAARICASVDAVIEGKAPVVRLAVTILLADGHLLIEDVPGVGKTMLAKSLARALGGSMRRLQFTPDLMPSDVTGVSVFNQQTRTFEFRPGGIFANVVLGDEINRASPKTQSALLEAMEERQVSVDGTTYALPPPFIVLATQNPVEMEGTYPLPEAQRDRFMARLRIGYPSQADEMDMVDTHGGESALAGQQPVSSAEEVAAMVRAVHGVHLAESVKRYAVELVSATRGAGAVRLGASPRATLHLVRAARARAALDRRDFVLPDDVQQLAVPVLAHRLLLTPETQIQGVTAEDVVRRLVETVPAPLGGGGRR